MLSIEQIRAMPGTYIATGLTINAWAIFYDELKEVYTIDRYSHSEVTTPFDRHWTMNRDYYAHCVPATIAEFQRLTGFTPIPGTTDILHPCESS